MQYNKKLYNKIKKINLSLYQLNTEPFQIHLNVLVTIKSSQSFFYLKCAPRISMTTTSQRWYFPESETANDLLFTKN